MNIGIVSEWYPGGFGYAALDLRKVLTKAGHNVFVFSRNKKPLDVEFHFDNISDYPNKNIPKEVLLYWLRRSKIDTCIFIGFDSLSELCLLKRVFNSCTVKFVSIPIFNCLFSGSDLTLSSYLFFHKILCTTKFTYDKFSGKRFNSRVKLIKWGFDSDIFKIVNDPTKDKDTLRILYPIGVVTKEILKVKTNILRGYFAKSRFDIQEDASMKPEAVLWVHMMKENLSDQNIDKDLGNMIITKGNFSRLEMAKLYGISDLIILPSKPNKFGLPFIESISVGVPVLTIGKKHPFVEHFKTGICLNEENVDMEFNYWITKFSKDKTMLKEMRNKVIGMRHEYSWDNIGVDLVKIIVAD